MHMSVLPNNFQTCCPISAKFDMGKNVISPFVWGFLSGWGFWLGALSFLRGRVVCMFLGLDVLFCVFFVGFSNGINHCIKLEKRNE